MGPGEAETLKADLKRRLSLALPGSSSSLSLGRSHGRATSSVWASILRHDLDPQPCGTLERGAVIGALSPRAAGSLCDLKDIVWSGHGLTERKSPLHWFLALWVCLSGELCVTIAVLFLLTSPSRLYDSGRDSPKSPT